MQWSPQRFLHPTQALLFHKKPEQTNQKQSVRAWTPQTLKRYPQVCLLEFIQGQISCHQGRRFSAINKQYCPSAGALKTDHTEVLLSADFTGAIKVFINVKKYWALRRLSGIHIQACLSEISPKDEGQPVVGGHLTSPNYLIVITLRQRAELSGAFFGRAGTLKCKTR